MLFMLIIHHSHNTRYKGNFLYPNGFEHTPKYIDMTFYDWFQNTTRHIAKINKFKNTMNAILIGKINSMEEYLTDNIIVIYLI